MANSRYRFGVIAVVFMQIGVLATGAQAGTPERPSFDGWHDDFFRTGRHRPTWVRISAFADLPLNFANVAIYDARGRLLFKSRHATNSQGVFAVSARGLPRNFRVAVTWDGYREQALDRLTLGRFTLTADEQNFDPVHDVVYVNPVSTLVSRVLDAYPGMPLYKARALVRSFLGMPRNASLGAALREGKYFRSKYFSAATFLEEARQHGGVDALLDLLKSDLSAQPDTTHVFAPAPGSPLQSALSFVAENLAKGALSWAGGQGCGWVAQSAGITTPGATAEDIANLQEGLANLQSSVDELSKQIQALTTQIFAKLTQTQYNQIVVPALALASQVNGVESDLTFFAQGCPAIPETGALTTDAISSDFCNSQKATIMAELNDVTINHSFDTLSTYVLDNPAVGFNGLIHLYSQSLGESLTFFRPADSTKLQNMFDYWDSVQTQAANLQVELLHLNDAQDNPGGVAQLTSFLGDANANPPTQGQFQKTHDSESALMFPAVPTGTVIYTQDRTMWATDNPVTTFPTCVFPPATQFGASNNPALGNRDWNDLPGWHSPSLAELQQLISGGGSSPMSWLVNQAKAESPDTPQSAGFPDVVAANNAGCVFNGPWVWTQTFTGNYFTAGGTRSPIYYLIRMDNGSVSSATDENGISGNNFNWLYLMRELPRGEQYYWYP